MRGPWGLHLNVAYTLVGAERQSAGRAQRVARPAPESAQPRRRVRGLGRRSAAPARARVTSGTSRSDRASPASGVAAERLAVERSRDLQLRLAHLHQPGWRHAERRLRGDPSEPGRRPGSDAARLRADDRTAGSTPRRSRARRSPTAPPRAIPSSVPGARSSICRWPSRSRSGTGVSIQFRVEAFNAFNWVNWGNPNGTLGNSNFGIISSAAAAREMQLSLKYTF